MIDEKVIEKIAADITRRYYHEGPTRNNSDAKTHYQWVTRQVVAGLKEEGLIAEAEPLVLRPGQIHYRELSTAERVARLEEQVARLNKWAWGG